MAVTLYKRPGSPCWYAQWTDPRGTRHQRSTRRTRRRDAEELAAQWERETLRDPADVARERATFGEALDQLEAHLEESVAAGRMAESTARMYAAKARPIVKYFGNNRKLSTLTPAAVRDYLAARRTAARVSDHTLVKEVATLRLVMRLARERGLWTGDPASLHPAELAARYEPRTRVLRADDIAALRPVLPAPRWRVVAWAIATGAELSTWPRAELADADMTAGLVRVRGTKRASRDRAVPVVLYPCAELLREAIEGASVKGPLFRPWPNAQRDLRAAALKASIEHFSPNDLRRTFATWHVEAGVPLELLRLAMGHATTTMLERVYGRPQPSAVAELMRAQLDRR